jgi:hypothetical protein
MLELTLNRNIHILDYTTERDHLKVVKTLLQDKRAYNSLSKENITKYSDMNK